MLTLHCMGNVNQYLSGCSGPCGEAVFSSLGPTLVWDSQCGTWVLQEGGRVRYGSAFLPFIIPSPPTPLPSKRNLHLRSRPDHILSLFAEETSILIKEYGSAFLPFIIPSLDSHQKTSQRNVWSSQPVAIFPVMKQLAANLVISNTNSLTPEFHYISPRLAQHHRGIPVWFNILAFYHPIPHPLEKSSTSQKIAIITINNDSSGSPYMP